MQFHFQSPNIVVAGVRLLQVLMRTLPALGLVPTFVKSRFYWLTTSPNNRFVLKCVFSLCFIVSPSARHGFPWSEFHGHFPKFPDRLRSL